MGEICQIPLCKSQLAHFDIKPVVKLNNNNILTNSASGGTLGGLAYFELCHSATLGKLAHFEEISVK
jgi:hypothetical protein